MLTGGFACLLTFSAVFLVSEVHTARRSKNEGRIRLIGGRRRFMGTVVISHNGYWGAVCDDMWGINDANVACKQLGFKGAVKATKRSAFGPGRKRMWMTRVRCSGREDKLTQCPFAGWDRHTRLRCPGRFRSAGVVCDTTPPTTTPPPTTTTTATTTTPTTTTSTTTTTTPTTTTTMSTTTQRPISELEVELAEWAANELIRDSDEQGLEEGIHDGGVLTGEHANNDAITNIENLSDFTTQDVHEESTPASITDISNDSTIVDDSDTRTPESEVENLSVSSENDVSDKSTPAPELSESTTEYSIDNDLVETEMENAAGSPEQDPKKDTERDSGLLADAPPRDEIFDIRMEGGRYKWEGHLRIRLEEGGEEGTICADHWGMKEAMVACRQIGLYGDAKQALQYSYFGGTKTPKVFYRVKCTGFESSLSECELTKPSDENSCSQNTSVAGLVCSEHLPDLVPNIRALTDSVRLQDQPLYYLRCSMEENCLAHSAYVIRNTSLTWRNQQRRLLRFSTVVHNRGLADFRPFLAKQQWEWHACHMHYHSMEVFAHYDIMNEKGERLAEGSKASFCLEDTQCDKGVEPKYNCRGFGDQGLSVNCSDNYMHDIDCQWIDITDIKPGDYTFLMEINPNLLVAESNYENNVISCHLNYNGYFAFLRNCHYENLLDYRKPIKIAESD